MAAHRFHLLSLLLLAAGGLVSALPAAAQAQTATLTGVVIGPDRQPLPAVNVFIAQSQRGTTTDAQGRYALAVPLGAHRLVASSVGYEVATRDLVLRRAGETQTHDFRLEASTRSVGEVTVEASRDARWQKRYERFKQRFLGETANARQTEILNPYVLDFDEKRGTLTAVAAEPLVIENRALGYRVRYVLTDFEAQPRYNFFDGEPLYEPLEPRDAAEAALWTANRRRAYEGSFRHLMRALVAGTLDAQGFHLYLLPNPGFGQVRGLGGSRSEARFPTTPDEILKASKQAGEYELRYPGILQAIYDREPEDDEYQTYEWNLAQRGPRDVQTSEVRFPTGKQSALLDRFGEELDPRSLTLSGYMAFERFADALPKEYGLAESGIPGAAEAAATLRETVAPDRPD